MHARVAPAVPGDSSYAEHTLIELVLQQNLSHLSEGLNQLLVNNDWGVVRTSALSGETVPRPGVGT